MDDEAARSFAANLERVSSAVEEQCHSAAELQCFSIAVPSMLVNKLAYIGGALIWALTW